MAPPPPCPKHPNLLTYHLMVVRILLLALASTTAASTNTYSSACPSTASAADSHTDAYDAHSLASSFQIYNGHFSAGGAKEDDSFSLEDDQLHSSYHSFHLFPDRAARTSDSAVVHLNATLDLTDPRRGRNRSTNGYVSFVLDGYYSSASLELCMVGSTSSGTTNIDDIVVLRLRLPSPPRLADPFVTGILEGSSDLGAIQLLAYVQGDDYEYGDSGRAAACSPPAAPPPLQALGVGGDIPECGHLIGQLVTSYRLVAQDEHHGGGAPARLLPQLMHVSQMQCTEEGAVRAYVVFSNDTGWRAHDGFVVGEAAAVAEGRWDSARGMLCLRACRVERSGLLPPSTLAVGECGIGMSFWFQAAWTVRDRSVVAGMLWNTSTGAGAGPFSGVNAMSAFSIDDPEGHHTRNLSAVWYEYNDRMLEEAKKHYYLTISREKKMRGSFPVPMGNYDTYHDFSLRFFGSNGSSWSGEAHPVSIGSVMMGDDVLAVADDESFSRHAVAGAEHGQLLSVSYDIHYDDHRRGKNSPRLERQQIRAEGVYDPERGILCMVGCREQDGSTPDCRVLVTVQFASTDSGRGVVSSLRDRDDRLFFEQVEISLYGMYSEQLREAVSRMDMESVMLLASTTLSCVFAAAQILHAKRSPEAAPATSVTMLAVLALGYLAAPLALSFETLFASRRSRYGLLADNNNNNRWLDLNQVMLNVPALLAFVLHLRLLQLAISGRRRRTVVDQGGKPPVTTSERTVLNTCLPLYLLGAVLTAIVHAVKIRAASEMGLRVVRVEDLPATLREELVSYTGMIVDGFLLPQVILNASGGSGVAAPAMSPWFYMGNTVIRVMPHVYDVVRRKIYEQSMSPSEVYASPRGDLFGVAWDIVVPCGAALLALLLFCQQRLRVGGAS